MSRKFQRRAVAAIVLILALGLGSPAHAAGLPDWGHVPTLFHQAWQWLAGVLPGAGSQPAAPDTAGRISTQKSATSVAPKAPTGTATADASPGVDPNG